LLKGVKLGDRTYIVRFVVRADEKLTAFLELESAIQAQLKRERATDSRIARGTLRSCRKDRKPIRLHRTRRRRRIDNATPDTEEPFQLAAIVNVCASLTKIRLVVFAGSW
jgi:hypothetical protein